jgi:2-aminoadipate transaminase
MDNAPSEPAKMARTRPAFARWLGTTNDVTRTFLAAGQIPDLINLAGGLPAPEVYPAAEIAEIARRVIEAHPADTLGYGPIEGLPELRDAVAGRYSSATLRLSRANVLITTSGIQGLDVIGKVLLEEGGIIAAQFPTYLGALDSWRTRMPAYRKLRLDSNDCDPLALFAGAQFAYTVPNFSNPTGKLVGMAMREVLVDAAHRTGTWLLEDDPYGGLHYDSEALPHLIELSALKNPGAPYDGPVLHVRTLSKEVAPGLRIGWVIGAPEMIAALTLAKQGSDMCTSGITQRIALEALKSGLIEKIQPGVVALYRSRRDALCAAMAEHLAADFDWEIPSGGMFVWATARDPRLNTDTLLKRAMEAGVCITPSSVFDASGEDRRAIRINFTLNAPDRLREGVHRLATAVRALQTNKG